MKIGSVVHCKYDRNFKKADSGNFVENVTLKAQQNIFKKVSMKTIPSLCLEVKFTYNN